MARKNGNEPLLKVFLSYANEDKEIAAGIKRFLEYFGATAFLAHEDIEFGEEWEREIFSALGSSHVLVAVLTSRAKESNYVNQEIGYALARDILILPFKVEVDPFGFTSRIQAFKASYTYSRSGEREIDFEASVRKVVEKISQKEGLSALLRRGVVTSFATSRSYQETQCKLSVLKKYTDLTEEEQLTILRAALSNAQVHKEWKMRDYLQELITESPSLLNSRDRALLKAKITAD